jgi:hypothetical protein
MKIWAEHRSGKHEDITCPLCRTDWGNNSLQELEKLNRQENSSLIHKGSVCMNCKESHSIQNPIRGTRYHCLMCKGVDLCETCYERVRHPHPFIMRKTVNSKWEPVIRHDNLERMQDREISDLDYEALRNLDNPPSLHEFYLSVLTNSRPGELCAYCDSIQPCSLRTLSCGHSGHESCLIEAFRDKRMFCPVDMLPIFLGVVSSHPQMVKLEPPRSRPGSHPLLSISGVTVGRSERMVPQDEVYRKVVRNPRENLKRPRKLPSSSSSNSREEMPAMLISRIQPERKSLFIANANNMLHH